MLARLRITCGGVVQGVGFRPAVHRLATSLGLAGWVRNTPEGVVIEVEGPPAVVDDFTARLPASLPPLARLSGYDAAAIPPLHASGFEVLASSTGPRARALVPPDSAVCRDCRTEMEDPADRRHRYPFTTCTNCGPRYSLVHSLPYDRARTAMGCFPLCPACRREYEDPANRRFHAEPLCCSACGPHLWLQRVDGERLAEGPAAIVAAVEALASGSIVAVKGLGGFQLACRADDEAAVSSLRTRKHRPTKPFAIMAADLTAAHRVAVLTAADEEILASARAPVLLAPRHAGAVVSPHVAPGLADIGVVLPTTPLHVELFRGAPFDALVMTSGNVSDEPICRTNREAVGKLARIADLLLLHDRDVVRRVDDSVFRSTAAGPVAVRRARGCVPAALPLPTTAPEPVLALGPHLQATACLAVGNEAFFSQHVGDLDTDAARLFLAEVIGGLESFLETEGRVIVVDAHPDYGSTTLGVHLAAERGATLLTVQHHLAHAAAVLAEHEAFPELGEIAAAIVLDGTGWGPDNTAWGGEWLQLDGLLRWRRLASLEPLPLVGGEAAVREPWRVAAAVLSAAGEQALLAALPMTSRVAPAAVQSVARFANQPGWPLATGAGRLFEAAGALLGLATVNSYEGEAAARLEALASSAWPEAPWDDAELTATAAGKQRLPSAAMLVAAARRVAAGEPLATIAAGFHATFCRLAARLASQVIGGSSRTVALGGGCLVNRLLREELARLLSAAGFEPLLPYEIPPGDGGISYGQAVIGAVATARGVEPFMQGGS